MSFNPLILLPVYFPILLGFVLRETGFFPEEYSAALQKFCLKVAIPFMVFYQMATLDTALFSQVLPLMLSLTLWMTLLWAAGYLFSLLPAFRSRRMEVILVTMLSNIGYVGWAVCDSVLGNEGLVRSIMYAVPLWPATIVLSILAQLLMGCGQNRIKNSLHIIKAGVPILAASFAGLLISLLGLRLPGYVLETIDAFGRMSVPLILFGVGLSLRFRMRDAGVFLLIALKLAAGFAAALLVVRLAGSLDTVSRQVILVVSLMPVGANSMIVGGMLDLDEGWIAGVIALSTLAALITIPLSLIFLPV